MKLKSVNKISRIEYFYILLLLFSSNTVCYTQANFALSAILFVALSFMFYFIKRAYLCQNSSRSYIAILCTAVLVNRCVFYPDVLDFSWLETILYAIGSYFFFSAFEFTRFRRALLNVMYVITIFNILVFVLDKIGVAPVQYEYHNAMTWRMVGPFVTGRTEAWGRMAGLWHEPGAYQIYLNSTILIHAPLLATNELSKTDWMKIVVLVLGVVLTFSTMGYIVLSLIGCSVAFKAIRKASWFYKLIIVITIPYLSFLLVTSEIIEDKFQQSRDAEVETSLGVRERDNLASFQMAIESPLIGMGMNSREYQKRSLALDNMTSSNGLLRLSAMLGIWWLIIYLIYLYKALRKMKITPILISAIAVILMQSNEAYVQYPISYMFIVQFASMRGYGPQLVPRRLQG